MRTLSIHTWKYREALSRFFPVDGELILERGSENGMDYVYACNRRSTRNRLQSLLEYIMLSDNPALAEGEKVFHSVADIAFRPSRTIMQSRLDEFLKEAGMINIEGYINFRLGEYTERINAILYSIVKKNLYKS
ncbi:MAG: putative sporulation protein YtxC [Defluviitaleaceae bacterium]|nr:putative sporulation protein YtxC [Defluviitaleaceae bacterium]